jgi:molybdate transport system substrate-binding protein
MSATVNVLTSNSMRAVMDELAPQFERATGNRVSVSYDPAKIILRRIAGGETPDLIICGASALEEMAKQGKIVAGTSRPVARCGVGIAVRTGAPKPDISSVEAFKRTLLNAKSVAYTQEGASGIHFASLIERWGIAEHMKTRAVRQPGGLVGELVAAGKAEIAVQQIPELMAVAGIELVGPLPQEVQATTVSAAGIFAGSKQADAARALLDFLSTPASASVLKAKGLEPV